MGTGYICGTYMQYRTYYLPAYDIKKKIPGFTEKITQRFPAVHIERDR